jgi:hypothetical protein
MPHSLLARTHACYLPVQTNPAKSQNRIGTHNHFVILSGNSAAGVTFLYPQENNRKGAAYVPKDLSLDGSCYLGPVRLYGCFFNRQLDAEPRHGTKE